MRFCIPCSLCAWMCLASTLQAQELPRSGTQGFDLVYATSPSSTSVLVAVNTARSARPWFVSSLVNAVPSRWAHRRRTLGALEAKITLAGPVTLLTPMGDAVGNGGIHMVDGRGGLSNSLHLTGGNPAGYDLAIDESLQIVLSAEDDGAGNTTLRGYSYAIPGQLVPLTPGSLDLAGSPSAYVHRMGSDEEAGLIHVPTTAGIHVVKLSAGAPHLQVIQFIDSGNSSTTTNPSRFDRGGTTTWVVGTGRFDPVTDAPLSAGFLSWDEHGNAASGDFGGVPSNPAKEWVPAAGTEELAVVSDGTDAYVYYLLREPPPGTFFIKPSAIGVVKFLAAAPATVATILCPTECGEPFANPAVHGTRVALESSLGAPFTNDPPGGAEKISILYSPLDPLGAATSDGLLAVPGPLGGRISTKGMDRPIWTHDGTRVVACTSHFPGAPNPALPGIEVLDVPIDLPVGPYVTPHPVVQNSLSPNRSIVFASIFDPRDPAGAVALEGLSFVGNAFHHGLASIMTVPYGEVGHIQFDDLPQSASIPNFPAILPPRFDDPNGSITPVPASFGARRTTFNLIPGLGMQGLVMSAAIDDRILVQRTGNNHLATFGLAVEAPPIEVLIPAGWITTTEFLSL